MRDRQGLGMRALRGLAIGCAATLAVGIVAERPARAGEAVQLKSTIDFDESAHVRPDVKDQCELQTKVPHFVKEYADSEGLDVQLVDTLSSGGRVLEIQIADTYETGNAWTGRSKGLDVEGRLLEDGKVIGSFRDRRSTRGGAFGGYKGNCAFFGRCAKTIGKDIAGWLKSPTMNARLGE